MVTIKKWSKFQHYRDRKPPWIKLYRDILDDAEWQSLSDYSTRLLTQLWLLASENNTGEIMLSDDKIMWRLRVAEQDASKFKHSLEELAIADFIIRDSGMIADCGRDAIPETEREAEKETEKKRPARRLSDSQKKRTKVPENSKAMIRIGKWFHRKESTLWTLHEAEALAEIMPLDKDSFLALEWYYLAEIDKAEDYRRRDLMTLLNNWQTEIDRAKRWEPAKPKWDGVRR